MSAYLFGKSNESPTLKKTCLFLNWGYQIVLDFKCKNFAMF